MTRDITAIFYYATSLRATKEHRAVLTLNITIRCHAEDCYAQCCKSA
jgi:hypothetical protein